MHLRPILAVAVTLLLVPAFSACRDGDSGDAPDESRRIVDAPIVSIDILVRESFTNTLPTDPDVICSAIYGYYESNVDLGQDFTSGRTYTVKVNDNTTTFVAQ